MSWTGPAGVALALVLAFGLTRLALWWLAEKGLVDTPNVRSSHAAPTPRGGGLAVVVAIAAAWLWGVATSALIVPEILIVLGLGLALAAVSFVDDLRGLPVLPRLVAQAAAVAVGLWALPTEALVFQGLLGPALDRVLAALVWLWFVSLYNFMDGIDGIAGLETVAIGFGAFVVLVLAESRPDLAYVAPCLAAAALGFLWWNRHPARIFLGDVGSVPLGFWVGWLLLSLAASGQWAAALLLPLYYLADATVTLARRLARGEPVWRAHVDHYYQRAARAFGRHDLVTRAILTANLGLIALAILSTVLSAQRLAWLIVGGAMTLALLWYLATRRPLATRPRSDHAA
jgi:UDP-N-acetylmuramyl pentapeptide phosphotransferase/UDP-N-acetylglucosamine-1-phosphate transferase